MNNMQLYLSMGIAPLTGLLAWGSNGWAINRLNDKVDKLGNSLRGEMIAFRREVHQGLLMLHERVVKAETRQES